MNQQEVEQWIAQNGGLQAVQYARATTQVDNPAADPITARQAGVRFDPNAQPKIAVATEKWTNPSTGAVLHVRRRSDGDFDIVEQATPNPQKSGDTAPPSGKPFIDDGPEAGQNGRRWGWNPQTKTYDRDLGPSPSAQQPQKPTTASKREPVKDRPGYFEVTTADATTGQTETHYEDANGNRVNLPGEGTGTIRKPVADRPGITEVTTKDPATNTQETHYEDANGNRVQLPGQGGSVRKPVPNRPGVYEVTTKDATTNATETHYEDESGSRVPTPTDAGAVRKPVQDHPGVYEVTTKDPATNTVETHFENESGQRVPTPADASKPVQVNGQWGVWKPNPNDPSGAPTFEPIQNAPSVYAPLPPGVPRFNVRFDVPDLGLGDRKAQLDALVTQGVITPAQANATMTADAGNAKAGAENLGAIVTIQEQNRSTGITQRGQDLGEQQSRRSFVGGLYNQAASGFNNSKVLPGTGAASANGFLAMMQAGMNLARQNGGFRDVPRVENGPLLNQFGQATLTPSGSYTVPTAAGGAASLPRASAEGAAPAAAPSAEDLPWLQHQPLTNSAPALAPAAAPAAAAPDTSSAITITIPHSPALLQPAPATTSGPLLAPPPLDPGETVTPQAGMWHPNHDGLIDDMVNAGFEPDAIAAAFPDLHRYGPSPSLVA